tara:strand:- start:386 stop:628 length:243 start_codon:yes stop_codon:yes gene_type:complete
MSEDFKEHTVPNHYNSLFNGMSVIDMQVKIWGPEAVAHHFEMSAFEYKLRAGHKVGQPQERDLAKSRECLDIAKRVREMN